MKTSLHFFARAGQRAAFARIELVVILLVVAMLTALGMSVIRGTKNQIKIAQCAGNLRQFALSHLLYAGDYSDKLPTPVSAFVGSWAWDVDWNMGNLLNQYGTPPARMYCPGTAPRFQPTNNMELYQYAPNLLHVIGYAVTLPGTADVPATNVNFTVTPQPIQFGAITTPAPRASQRVLIADANLTMQGSGNFYAIPGGYSSGGRNVPHTSPHLDGLVPAGGNLAMLDGHVEWRPFSQMEARTPVSAAPIFYW